MGEAKDVLAVCDYLKKLGLKELFLAGYSFGAWVGSKVLEKNGNPFAFAVCVSPPINYFNFNWDNINNKINLFICGDCDQFCSLDVLIRKAQKINSPVVTIRDADHFYMGKERELADFLRRHLAK